MKISSAETKEQLIRRLGRVEGQLRGIQDMLRAERDCREILQQLTAAGGALRSAARVFLRDYAALCLADMETGPSASPADQAARRAELVEEMVAFLGKAP